MNFIKKSHLSGILGVAIALVTFVALALSSGRLAQACDNNKSRAKTASATQAENTADAKTTTAETTEVLTCPVTGVSVRVVSGCGIGEAAAKTAEMRGEQMQVHTAEMVSGNSCPAAAKAAAKTVALHQGCEKTQSSATVTTVATESKSCSANRSASAKLVENVAASQENTARVIE